MRKKRSRRAKKKAGRRKVGKKVAKKTAVKKVKKAASTTKAALAKLMKAMSNQRLAEHEAGEVASIKLANRKQLEHAFSGGHARDEEAAEAAGLFSRGLAAFSNAHLQNGNGHKKKRK